MKKSLIIGSAMLLSLTLAIPVSAQTGVRAEFESRRAELTEKIKENQSKLMEARQRMMGQATTTPEFRKELRTDIAKRHLGVAERVFNATIERLETLIDRIQSRIDKVKGSGTSTDSAEALVEAAEDNIVDAKAHISAIASLDVSATSTARANFELIKGEVKAAREALVSAKQNLMKAVQALKGLGNVRQKSTTTPETNEDND